jgi:hypothetical protein
MEDKQDHELVKAYAHGSRRAFEVLYRRYRRRLYVYAYSLLRRLQEKGSTVKLLDNKGEEIGCVLRSRYSVKPLFI